MELIPFSDKRILYIGKNECLAYYRGKLYYKYKEKEQKCQIGTVANNVRILERLLRKEPRCAAKVSKIDFIVSFNGSILRYNVSNNSIIKEFDYERGMNNPLSFQTIYNNTTGQNSIYFGEYIWNNNKGPVAIYIRENNTYKKIYEFPEHTIQHIHNIIFDIYRNGFFILTGDDDAESGIWFADKRFSTVRPVLVGSQQYRACVAFPDSNGIFYATDTPLEDNYIYYAKLDKEMNVKSVEKKYNMSGPCIYGCRQGDSLFFSTSVEPDSSMNTWRYRLTYRLGKGVKDRYTHIIKGNSDGTFMELARLKKDFMPIWLFQFGNVIFPTNDRDSSELIMVLQSTVKGHGKTVAINER